jgi:Uma2 family endonuclease
MTAATKRRLTAEEYLALERRSETKSDFVDGDILARAGAIQEHITIESNIGGQLYIQLRGGRCRSYGSNARVKVSETGAYVYPDLVVVCGEPVFEDEHGDSLLNPTLIIEVLSPSTEAYDRGEKWGHYRELSSLQEYVMVAQDRHRIERYARLAGTHWDYSECDDPDGTVVLDAIGAELKLADVYEGVALGAPEA